MGVWKQVQAGSMVRCVRSAASKIVKTTLYLTRRAV